MTQSSATRLALAATLAAIAVTACGDGTTAMERLKAAQRRNDPLMLWTAQVVWPETSAPVKVCADTFVREGFERPLPSVDGKSCALTGYPEMTPGRVRLQCVLDGHLYDVRSWITGDPEKAFEVDFVIDGGPERVRQVRRYKRLGPCPAGWEIGDNTDRAGNLRKNALDNGAGQGGKQH